MRSVNIHEAKTHLSRLVEDAAHGQAFIISKAGRPMVKVVPFTEGEQHVTQRLGFMAGEIAVPDDFDSMSAAAIAELFEGAKEGILPV